MQARPGPNDTTQSKERRKTPHAPQASSSVALLPSAVTTSAPHEMSGVLEIRHQQIATAAYLRAEKRGFTPGHELEDWLAAEQEVDAGVRLLE